MTMADSLIRDMFPPNLGSGWALALPLLITISALGLLSTFAIIIYRLYFHPLATYPGPFFARITDWYNVYHCLKGDRHLEFYRIHQKYGRFVRYGPNRVSICSSSALRTIYGARANVQKSSNFNAFLWFFNGWSTQTMIDTAKHGHAQKRSILAQALGEGALKAMEETILQSVRQFCKLLKDQSQQDVNLHEPGWSSSKDMAVLAGRLSFDVMNQVCFGHGSDTLEKEDDRYILDVISDGVQCLNTVSHMQPLLLTRAHKLLFRTLLNGLERYKAFSLNQCTRHLQNPNPSTDVFTHLSRATHPKTSTPLYTTAELCSESSLLLVAGSETTSTSLAATLFYLSHNPSALSLVQTELDSHFQHPEHIRHGPPLSACHYLRACITESLRLSPPVGGLMAREVLPGGLSVDGHLFPAGCEIGTPHYALHHDERYYPEPFQYTPERWLGTDHGTMEEAQRAFCAFSIGPRGCVGKTMAYQELMTVLGRVLWQYDVRLDGGSEEGFGGWWKARRRREGEYQLYDTFSSKSVGPRLQFRSRRRAGF